MMNYLYYWFKSVPENRPGGPWWIREFELTSEMELFMADMKPFLHAYCITREGATWGGKGSPPKEFDIQYREESWGK